MIHHYARFGSVLHNYSILFCIFKKKKPSTSTWDLVGQRIEVMSLLLNTRGKRGGRQFLNRLFGRFKKNTVLPSDVNALAQ